MKKQAFSLLELVDRHNQESDTGIYSVCSSHRFVLLAAMKQARRDQGFLLIEPTANQVNQEGGYTGRTPSEFVSFISTLAGQVSFPINRIILGGDHLGPNPWKHLPAEEALLKSETLIEQFVRAGFHKIHLDASIPCADDDHTPDDPLDDRIIARRTARLCKVAEQTFRELDNERPRPVYVIGTEVPVPGGSVETLEEVEVTPVQEAENTLELTKSAFETEGLNDAWERVIAMVVQPGVEFGDRRVVEYNPDPARQLSEFIESRPVVYEAHSTDYQTLTSLRELVRDHFAVLKVGPELTFTFREGVYALNMMEQEWLSHRSDVDCSNIRTVQEEVMRANPEHWSSYYSGSEFEQAFSRKYSYSDRSRYYWNEERMEEAVRQLFDNMREHPPPPMLIRQFFPGQYRALRHGSIDNTPEDLVLHRIMEVTDRYSRATNGSLRSSGDRS